MFTQRVVYVSLMQAMEFTDSLNWGNNKGLAESTKRFLSNLAQDFIFLGASSLTCVRMRCTVSEQLGHDLWLTCNGHGAGFWDGDWEGGSLPRVLKYCQGKEMETYVGDDGYVYILGHEQS